MGIQSFIKTHHLDLYVKDVIVLEEQVLQTKKTLLPFFADGYPGIVFLKTKKGACLFPKNKKLSDFFIYGQTVHPIEIEIEGSYKLIIFQLYPFAVKILFGVNPKELNDECYDLSQVSSQVNAIAKKLAATTDSEEQKNQIAAFLSARIIESLDHTQQKIQLAVNLILNSQGKITIKSLCNNLHTTERTLQRHFLAYIGLSPKQFATIIQFQSSFNQLSDKAFTSLSEIVFDGGYADQSHFIRSFKKFTGKKPSAFKSPKEK
ncbi:AraC family transcriptional regulator [Sphingobacteriaceae bacterium]|nr:AraC family transcriptional regulator [Sphingobacteriaceae bacterium]